MSKILNRILNKKNKKLNTTLIVLLIFSAAVAFFSFSQPPTSTNQITENTSQIQTTYDYKATITPNVLYPDGGTVEVGETIFKKITTAIPFHMKSTINSGNQVLVKGTHEVQLTVKAENLWERTFQLEEKQAFEQKGTETSIIDTTYTIDFDEVKSFITQVEEETGVRPEQYTLEVVPNIEGTITYNGVEKNIQQQDKLAFNFTYNEVKLASEKSFTAAVPFTTTETLTNTFRIGELELPLGPVQAVSTLLSLLLLISLIYIYRDVVLNRGTLTTSLAEKINKKYGSRIIPVSQQVNMAQKSIFTLNSFKSILTIADEKELPIFCYKDKQESSTVYFIVDGDYMYSYEASKTEPVMRTQKGTGSEKAYAKG